MASYSNSLRLTLLSTGEGSGTWGNTTNDNLTFIASSFGFGTEAITTNADTHTTTIADGATDPGRSIFLKYTGTLDSACTITIGPNTVSKLWFIENATSGSQSIIIKQGSGSTITIPNGQTKAIYSDGAGSGGAMVDAFQDLSIPDLFVDDDLTVGDDLIFSSDSAIIKFGADADTTLTHTDGSGLTLNSTNKIMFNDASQFIQGSSATVLSLGATDEIDLTATAIDINGTLDVSGTSVFNADVTITDTDTGSSAGPTLNLFRDSSSPADSDLIGVLKFQGEDDGSNVTDYGTIAGKIADVTGGTEDGVLLFSVIAAGSSLDSLTLSHNEAVFNNGSADYDFRVESDGNQHAIFMEASTGNTMFGGSSFDNGNLSGSAGGINVFDATHPIVLLKETTGNTTFYIGKSTSSNFIATEDAQPISIATTDVQRVLIEAGGNVTINEPSNDCDFRVESNGNANMLFIDGGNDRVAVGTNSPAVLLDIVETASATDAIIGITAGTGGRAQIRSEAQSDGTSSELSFHTMTGSSTSEAVRIDENGKVGIGVTDPTELLHLQGDGADLLITDAGGGQTAKIGATGSNNGIIELNNSSHTSTVVLNTSGDSYLNGGDVGIGTTSPSEQLHIQNANDAVVLIESSGSDATDDARLEIKTTNGTFTIQNDRSIGVSGALTFAGASSDILVLDHANSLVGLGTASPQSLLHLSSTSPTISMTDTNSFTDTNDRFIVRAGADIGLLQYYDDSASTFFNLMEFGLSEINVNDNSNDRDFRVESDSSTHALFVDAGNNAVGIGASSLTEKLEVSGSINTTNQSSNFTTGVQRGFMDIVDSSKHVRIGSLQGAATASGTEGTVELLVNGSTKVTINTSGDFFVGTTAQTSTSSSLTGSEMRANGINVGSVSGNVCFIGNRLNSDGDIAAFRRDGSTVGSIGSRSGSNLYLAFRTEANGDGCGLTGSADSTGSILPASGDGGPQDNHIEWGSASFRFKNIYAANGTIQTSDRNQKQDIEDLSEAEKKVAVAAKSLIKKFRFKSSVEEKGETARIHVGIIAQELQAAFESEGLDASRYGMFCSDTWTDDDGNEQTRLGVRYSELLAFIIAAI